MKDCSVVIKKECKVVLEDILKKPKQKNNNGKVNTLFSKCDSGKCKLKDCFVLDDNFTSSCTLRNYKCVTPPGVLKITCHTPNVVYLLTCSSCGLQYVGETAKQLNERFNKHRSGIKNPAKYGTCKILSNHFTKGICKGSKFSVQIIEKLEGSGRTERKAIDKQASVVRRKREDFWIKTLRTVYPYGLNDKLCDDFMKDPAKDKIGLKFPSLKRLFDRGDRRLKRFSEVKFTHDTFLKNLEEILNKDIKSAMNFVRKTLTTVKKSELRRLGDTISELLLTKPVDFYFSQWYSAALDIIDCRLFKPPSPKKKRPPISNFLRIHFSNKGIELVNLSQILHQQSVIDTVPSVARSFKPPTIVHSLDAPIGSKIFNFNKFVSSLDVDLFLRDSSSLPCHCSDSPFKDDHHGHIISGDLRIIENNRLRKLFTKGPKYREGKLIDWNVTQESMISSVKECAQAWCEKHKMDRKILTPWISVVSEKIKEKISSLKSKQSFQKHSPVLSSNTCLKALAELHENFVIVPIDKAANNIALVCKRFYAKVLVAELGLDGNNTCPTYEKVHRTANELIEKDCKNLMDLFKLSVDEDSKKLPHIYWTPKLHKNPLKFRFIIAAPNCSIKPLSKAITKIFKLFYRQVETYNSKCFYYSNVKTFWVIQNNEHVINSIKKLNKRGSLRSMATFDFSTLYTKIPHEKLLDVMNQITDFCFQGGAQELISLSKNNACWVSRNNRSSGVKFSKTLFKEGLEYLLNNCLFTCGNKIFRQVIGLPMGADPSPFMANLFLYHYESQWIKSLKKDNIQKARRFAYTFRFIDDLLTINDDNLFLKNFKNIYPPELQLNLENSGDTVNFLDLSLTNNNGHIDVKLYDKRDNFPFSIVRLLFTSSNIPSRMFYNCVGAEILRIGRVSSSTPNFIDAAKSLIDRAKKQGGKDFKLENVLKRMYGRHQALRVFQSNAKKFSECLLYN